MNLLVGVVACFVVSVVQFSAASDTAMLVTAGSGTDSYSGDNGPATSAELDSAYSVWVGMLMLPLLTVVVFVISVVVQELLQL
jgi:hypothetical protein